MIKDLSKPCWPKVLPASLLVAGNVLGVGVLALPIKLGLSGFVPTIFDIILICALMLTSGFIIATRLPPHKKHFDIPSFFARELGAFGKWIAIPCNLILLYGVLIAYLSGISSILHAWFQFDIPQGLIIVSYFLFATCFMLFGYNILKKSNTSLLFIIFICFILLIYSGSQKFDVHLLTYMNWKLVPIGLPVVVSAFHFHNIIPTVSHYVENGHRDLYWAIMIGVLIGLVMNIAWVTIVLGTLSEFSSTGNNIIYAFLHNLPATIPMTNILHSKLFAASSLLFAVLAVTASYVANGTGLYGFVEDLLFYKFASENKLLIASLTFLPPLIITLIYPHIFLVALDIVGGIGETILFIVLPGLILVKLFRKSSKYLTLLGFIVALLGLFIFLYIIAQKLGLIHLMNFR